jgi:lipopolysaccharide/colanic/teichoic acid biosynthesis glycosyltransferase
MSTAKTQHSRTVAPALRAQLAAKSAIDRMLAGLALVLLAPLLVLVALAIRLGSRGPVLFRQARTGKDRQVFEILKFRTMTSGAGLAQATRNDARVTHVGRWLRRTSFDELPQLWNVLRGDMALVGPRPHAIAHDDRYAPLIANYALRHVMKPGMTGWAQINNARGETDTLEKMARRVSLDFAYIDGWTLPRALMILALTPIRLLTARDAF